MGLMAKAEEHRTGFQTSRGKIVSFDAIRNVAIQIELATEYQHIFGPQSGSTIDEKLDCLKAKAKYLIKTVHPDKVLPAERTEAEKVFVDLMKLYEGAKNALVLGTYNEPFSKNGEFEIVCPDRKYKFRQDPFKKGHISNIYLGRCTNPDKVTVICKISKSPACNPMLLREAEILRELHPQAIAEYIPTVFDVTSVSLNGKLYTVLVLSHHEGYYSLADIMSAYPAGVGHENAAWISRRVIAQALCANILDTIHGSIIPEHILINPMNHKPLHIGWAHSLKPSDGIPILSKIIPVRRNFYPPEVFRREPLTKSADIYMVGKVMLALFGGNVESNLIPFSIPKPIRECVIKCLSPHPSSRYQNAMELMDEFTTHVRNAWGKKFSELVYPK